MLLIHKGRMRVHIGGRDVSAGPGQTLLYLPGQLHEEWNDADRTVELTYFGFTWEVNDVPDTPRHVPVLESDHAGRIAMLARWMVDLAPRLAPGRRVLLDPLMHAVLIEHELPAAPPAHALVQRVQAYVQGRLARRIGLDELAALAGVSRFHFSHTFRAVAGVSPMRFVRRVRLEAAYGLVVTTSLPLKQIARQTRFADGYALSKAFHQTYARWPSSFRRQRHPA